MADNDFAVDIPQYAPGSDPNGPGQPAYLNNNPGNIKFAGQPGTEQGTPASDGGYFAKFKTPEEGYRYLRDQHLTKFQNRTLAQHLTTYAPPGSNDTSAYIASTAKDLGVTPDTLLSKIDREKLAQSQIKTESGAKVRAQDAFDRADAAPLVTKPGEVPLPTSAAGRTPRGAWDPSKSTVENIIEQGGEIPEQVGRNIGGLATAVEQKAKDVWHLIQHPSTIFDEPMETPAEQIPHLKDLPVIGPLSEGRYGAAVGDVATGALMGKLGGPEGEGEVEGATPKITKPTVPTTGIGEEPLPSLKQRLADITPSPEEAAQRKAIKPLAEQFPGVKDPISAQAKYGKTIPEMQELAQDGGVKITKDNAGTIADAVKDKNIRILQHYQDAAAEAGNLIDGRAIAKDIRTTKLNDPSPKAAAMNDQIEEEAKSYEKFFTIPQMMQLLKEKNQFSGSFYDMKPSDQYQAAYGKQVTDATLGAIRRETYRAMDPKSNGAVPQELQHRIGSAIEMRDSVYDRNSQAIKAKVNTPGVLPTTSGDLTTLGVGGPKAYALKKGIDIIGNKLGGTPDSEFESVFRKYKGSYDKVPDPGPRSYKLNLSSEAPPEQRGLFDEGVTNPSNPNDWRSQTQDLPVHQLLMKGSPKEEPYPTQRRLFKEGIVNPKTRKPPNPSSHGAGPAVPGIEDPSAWRYGN